MMPALVVTFPGRRYHATPWGHHVNEGLVEWPPSPWRLLRALVSVGYTTLGWHEVPQTARRLFLRLAEVLPRYRIPAAVATHSRHYMPIGKLRPKDMIENTTLAFDAWARIEDGALTVEWPCELPPDEGELLGRLASHMGYLGRSESWVEARLLADDAPRPPGLDVAPCEEFPRPGANWEQVALMAVEPPERYEQWRKGRVAAGSASDRAKASAKHTPLPEDIIACLQQTSGRLREEGWSQPPGIRRVLYWRPRGALEVGAATPRAKQTDAAPVQFVLLALSPASGNLHTLPQARAGLPQAERLHRALVKRGSEAGHSDALFGRALDGAPLKGHRHAHVLPLDLDDDHHLDHVLLWTPMGLDAQAQRAVRSIRKTFAKGVAELRVALVGMGGHADIVRARQPWGRALAQVVGPAVGAVEWISRTPFVPPRFLKARGRNSLVEQVSTELAQRGHPRPASVEVLDDRDDARQPGGPAFRHHVIVRRSPAPSPPQRLALALRLLFDAPVQGPLCLGYASHFGLGRFDAVIPTQGPDEPLRGAPQA